jgi:hypothetical protein
MKRLVISLSSVIILLLACATIPWFVSSWNSKEFRLGNDLRHAVAVLNRVQVAQKRCWATRGQFAQVQDLGLHGCGLLDGPIASGIIYQEDGFAVEVHVEGDMYSVRVHPINKTRLHFLFLDQAGRIHFGTRDWPASAQSPLLTATK